MLVLKVRGLVGYGKDPAVAEEVGPASRRDRGPVRGADKGAELVGVIGDLGQALPRVTEAERIGLGADQVSGRVAMDVLAFGPEDALPSGLAHRERDPAERDRASVLDDLPRLANLDLDAP